MIETRTMMIPPPSPQQPPPPPLLLLLRVVIILYYLRADRLTVRQIENQHKKEIVRQITKQAKTRNSDITHKYIHV
jgi:hypothetical protein